MRTRLSWFGRLFVALMLLAMASGGITMAQDGTPVSSPEASPAAESTVDSASSPAAGENATPDATPNASPIAQTCTPYKSKASADVRKEIEENYSFDTPTNTDSSYVTGATGDLQSVNPFIVESSPSSTVTGWIFDPLLGGNPKDGQPVAGGVTDWFEIAADCVTYTFHLRTDKVFSDGNPLTAADVAFSFESMADPDLASPYTGTFNDYVSNWTVIDDHTIQMVSNGVRSDFMIAIGYSTYIIEKSIWVDVPRADWATDPGSTGQDPSRVVGTGPFKFESWTQGQEIKLVRNDSFTPKVPYLKDITIRIFADHEAEFNAFLTGDLDDVGLEPEQVTTVQQQPDQFRTYEFPDQSFDYYEFNLNADTTTLFQDVRVRQAFMFALDRQSMVDNILLGHGVVAHGPMPVISFAYAPDQMDTIFNYDPDKAKQLLAEAGWSDSDGDGIVDKDGQAMSFDFLYPSGDATYDTLVAYMQDAWKAVGIDMHPKALEFSALIEATTTNLDWSMALYGFNWDPSFFQDVMFGCDQYQVGFNDMKYCNPDLDALFDQIVSTLDQTERTALMIQYSNIVNDEQPIGVLFFRTALGAENIRLHNTFPGVWGGPGIEYVWVADS